MDICQFSITPSALPDGVFFLENVDGEILYKFPSHWKLLVFMNNVYQTKDLNEASYLYCVGQRLTGLERGDGFFWFLFENETACQGLADDFWRGETKVDAKKYADAIRTLKDRIFSRSPR